MEGIVPVFLSHKKTDRSDAISIASYLKNRGVICYVDEFDPTLQNTNDITKSIMDRVRACSHLMAVVSENTNDSWWVPFEIGVASEIDKRICSYKIRSVSLPEYLEKWPILRTSTHLDKFIQHYKNDNTVQLNEGRTYAATIRSADSFHRTLKSSIGQY